MRLIDADALKDEFCAMLFPRSRVDVLAVIDKLPTIEAQPVKHGRWETWGFVFHGIEWERCSECGKPAEVSYQGILEGRIEMATPAICSCCGAKMNGGKEDG